MLSQYESINQHAIAERDELFAISHEQEHKISEYQGEVDRVTREFHIVTNELNKANHELTRVST
jgi:hypothetical protein